VFRALCAAVALAMTPAGASAQAAASQQVPSDWEEIAPAGWEFIQMQGWTLVSRDEDTLVFHKAARQPMHVWVRFEKMRPFPSGLRSWSHLVQVDCSGGRRRNVTGNNFSGSNLEGFISAFGPEDWTYPEPGSRGEFPLIALCD